RRARRSPPPARPRPRPGGGARGRRRAGAGGGRPAPRGRSGDRGRRRRGCGDGRSRAVSESPTIDDVRAAQERLHAVARVTPVYSSETLSRLSGRTVLLKAENLQRTGAFKIRGAYNTIAQLSAEERSRGVLTASAGNHGQAVAWAAREAGIAATIFVPEAAPMAKIDAAPRYGAAGQPAAAGVSREIR